MAKEKRSCSECPSTFDLIPFDLIPPADKDYCIPKLKPTKRDFVKRLYECKEGHRNTVYWQKESRRSAFLIQQ
jgi:hypothetical protein